MAEEIEEEISAEQPAEEVSVTEDAPKKKKKWPIVLIAVVVVIAALGIGFFFWHQQPSFCNAICHTPMDNYVKGYYDNASGKLANTHAQANVKCLDCHEATISDQVTEGIAWITGNYKVDASGNIVGDNVTATKAFCAKSGCHDWNAVVVATTDWGGSSGVNPHSSHQGTIACSNCHSVHGTSTMYCNSCHSWKLPTGWTNPK
jgi:hypothetical protein